MHRESEIGMGSRNKTKRIYLESFANGTLIIRKFDHVMISNEDADDFSDTIEQCFVAKVVDLYDNGKGTDDRHRAVVEWYLRPKDLEKKKKLMDELRDCDEREVIRYCGRSLWPTDIDAESIFAICEVVTIGLNGKVPSTHTDEKPVFFVRWTYSANKLIDAVSEIIIESKKTPSSAKRCLFGSNVKVEEPEKIETKVENEETKSPFKSFYSSSSKKQKSVTYRERDLRKRKLFSGEEDETKKTKNERKLKNLEDEDRFEEARRNLHASMLPTRLPCRKSEYEEIYSFVKAKLQLGSNGCVYISGVPGSGKTATVFEVMKNLIGERDKGDLCDFKFIALNGMKLTDPHQIYVQVVKELTDQKMSARYAVDFLSKHFNKIQKKHVVLLVDELDLLYTKRQDVLYNLFEWPSRSKARLIVVSVANTMNLPERIMSNRIASRVGMARITFQPYTYKQLEEIIEARISESRTFKPDAVRLVARKVGAVCGDARRALDICRRATEIADEIKERVVGVSEVDKALQEMFSSPKFLAIQNSSLIEQILLRAIATQFSHSGVEECTWGDVFPNLLSLCRLDGITTPNESQACAACFQLARCRLIVAEDGRKDREQRIRLNVSTDDIAFALGCKLS